MGCSRSSASVIRGASIPAMSRTKLLMSRLSSWCEARADSRPAAASAATASMRLQVVPFEAGRIRRRPGGRAAVDGPFVAGCSGRRRPATRPRAAAGPGRPTATRRCSSRGPRIRRHFPRRCRSRRVNTAGMTSWLLPAWTWAMPSRRSTDSRAASRCSCAAAYARITASDAERRPGRRPASATS